jgi:DNA-cytosine methyltransferase
MNRIGSLCTGYGGLDMAVENVLGGEVVWYSEFDKHPSTLLAQRFPGIPNLGDLTKIDWRRVEPVDILTGGYPCQPFSPAGKRLGEDDPRHLWPHIREAIRVLRPRVTILENVDGHRSLGFATVLRDCAEDGLDVHWVSVRASDAGAPHKRERLFFVVSDPEGIRQPAARGIPQVAWVSADGSSEVTADPSHDGLPKARASTGRAAWISAQRSHRLGRVRTSHPSLGGSAWAPRT